MKATAEQGQRNGRVKADFSPERHIRGSYELFCDDGVTEIRSFDDHGATYSGYFDNADEFAAAVLKQDAANRTTYVTLNPVNPALLAKCNNRSKKVIGRKGTTTPDKHIQRRRWVLVDCDPVRPADVPSTKEEKAAALERVREIRAALEARGFLGMVLADSGNGYHLLIPVDLPNDEASTDLVKGTLETLDFLFGDERVKIDASVYNASRITKLYGTTPHKGDGTQERPHRPSRLLSGSRERHPVGRELLERLAEEGFRNRS